VASNAVEMGQKSVFLVKIIPTFFWGSADNEQATALPVING